MSPPPEAPARGSNAAPGLVVALLGRELPSALPARPCIGDVGRHPSRHRQWSADQLLTG
ncbi:hypothetical protein [Saccharopolyspora elongata]|uniref:hypothetical protein n=1 Tax=Saccharopolyspora elongata TaxID=2530387 RepID=UPI001404E30E|nr:hypothetical protein [Saccharopolyspora elongata]